MAVCTCLGVELESGLTALDLSPLQLDMIDLPIDRCSMVKVFVSRCCYTKRKFVDRLKTEKMSRF